MPVNIQPAQIPVILLYNVDPDWTQSEKNEAIGLTTQLGHSLMDMGHPLVFVPIYSDNISVCLDSFDPAEHIVFNWCEGLPGLAHSEWLAAKRLETLGFTFTGADSATLALSQDKFRVKLLLDKAGIPTPAWRVFHCPDPADWKLFPAIVKPVQEHCSAGITADSVVLNPDQLKERIAFILERYKQPALVEDFIDGREFHVSVWGNESLTMLPPAEMDFSFFSDLRKRLCTYDSKFIPGSEHYEKIETLLPAPLTDEELRTLDEVCQNSYRAVGCRDYARMDIRLRGGIFYVLDVNPNADISSDASMACAAEVAGISYGQMGSIIVEMAVGRHPVMGKIRDINRRRKKNGMS